MSLVSVSGSRPERRISGERGLGRARRHAGDRGGDRFDMGRRRAAAAADDVDQAVAGEAADLGRHRRRGLVVEAEFVGQAGVGIGADERVGDFGDLGEVLAHRRRAERAIEPDRERAGVAQRMPEGGRRLARQRAAGKVGDRAGDHQRQAHALGGEGLLAGEHRRLGVERVEDRLDQDEVGAAVDQAGDLLGIGLAQHVEGDGAEAGIVDVGRDRGGAVGRPERAGDEAALAVDALGLERGAAGEAGGVAVELVDHRLHAVVGLGDRRRGKGVGLQDVGAGERIGEVDVLDRLRLGQGQQIVVALEGAFAAGEALAAELALVEAEVLDLGPHRAVEDQHALARRRRQRRADVALSRRSGEQLQWAGGHSRGGLLDITT